MPPAGELRIAAARAEALGFDSIWATDRVASPSAGAALLECLTTLAFFAGVTNQIRLGASVLLLPVREPVLLAKQIAALDYLSEGRLVLGCGIGQNPADYAAVNIPYAERGRRMDEMLPALRTLWSDSPASFWGRFYSFSDVWVEPAPAQDGGPPCWIGGISDAALRRAGRFGDGWQAYMVSPETFSIGLAAIRRHASAASRDPSLLTPSVMLATLVRADGQAAREEARQLLTKRYGREVPAEVVRDTCLAGSPAECRERIAAYVAAGAEHIVFSPISRGSPLEECELIAGELLGR